MFEFEPPVAKKLYKKLPMINYATSMKDIKCSVIIKKRHDGFTEKIRYIALNFCNVKFRDIFGNYDKNTIEFRSQNATINPVIWQNNINVFSKMLVTSREKLMDEEFLDYKLKHEFISYSSNKYLYNNVNLKNVLEFVDLVFDNNLDKVYFLRQYLKNFEENYGIEFAIKTKKFVK
ncbi:MAG: hypothetical protein NC181_03235 [Clostridium sp.]|nr:hypothetical protein [Clostridium sp.]MCM1444304.1 hypothetical protein [Candidatus Amulumruptor caecigallinarius]